MIFVLSMIDSLLALYTKLKGGKCLIYIGREGNPVNAYTMGGIVRNAGLSVEEFRKLLWSGRFRLGI